MHAGLAREDLFTVVLEQRLTDTALYADIVLPATMQPEHLDLHNSYGHHYVTLNMPAVEPPGACLPEQRDLPPPRARAGARPPAPAASPTRRSRATCSTATAARAAGITFERLRDEGALRVTPPGVARFAEGGFPTAERHDCACSRPSSPRAAPTR